MYREAPQHEGGPVYADVHPEMVTEWEAHGWIIPPPVEAHGQKAHQDPQPETSEEMLSEAQPQASTAKKRKG